MMGAWVPEQRCGQNTELPAQKDECLVSTSLDKKLDNRGRGGPGLG